jgi:predicted MFS family arabinose efflux permease
VLGLVADRFNYSAVYYVAAALTAIALILYVRTVAKKRPAKA